MVPADGCRPLRLAANIATIPATVQMSPATTWTATMLRNSGEDEGIGMPRTTTPSSLMEPAHCVSCTPNVDGWRESSRGRLRAGAGRGGGARLLDELVGADEDGLRDREPESLGSPQIDDQIEFRGLLDRQITGLGTFENFVDVKGQALVKQWLVRPIGHEAA